VDPGLGFDHAKYGERRAPSRADLDRATSRHPVAVSHVSGHYVLVNSMALSLRGIDESVPDPAGAAFARDPGGRLTGLRQDAAMGLVLPVAVDIGSHGPNFHTKAPLGELGSADERAGRAFLAAGLTTACDAQVTSRELEACREARRLGRLPVRTVCMPLSRQLDSYRSTGLAGPFGDGWLSVGAMKFYADGSLIGGTAAFSAPTASTASSRLPVLGAGAVPGGPFRGSPVRMADRGARPGRPGHRDDAAGPSARHVPPIGGAIPGTASSTPGSPPPARSPGWPNSAS